MARVTVFLDHDIVIRHFLRNGLLQHLQATHDVTFVFPASHKRVRSELAGLGLTNVKLFKIDEQRAFLWRRLYQHEVLRRARHGSGASKSQIYAFWREALHFSGFWRTWLMSWPGLFHIYRRRALRKIGKSSSFEQLMAELKPDVIVHPTVLEGLFVNDLIRWGKAGEVPTVFLMNSWDNPAVKAMACGHPDWLVVWGEQTRRLAHEHLGMPLDKILTFGAAQFDVYREPPQLNRAEFLRTCGIAENQPLIVYAGSSKGVKEVQHLIALEDAIERGILPRCHVLFRPHPWRGTIAGEVDFFSRAWKHVTIDPEMADYYRRSLANPAIIHTPDIAHTHVVLAACDLLISPVSTILLEAVIHGKPILAYLPEEDIDRNFFLRTMANMNFMQEFFERTQCGPIRTMEELIARSREALLEDAAESAARIRKTAEYFVLMGGRSYVESLAGLIEQLVASPGVRPS